MAFLIVKMSMKLGGTNLYSAPITPMNVGTAPPLRIYAHLFTKLWRPKLYPVFYPPTLALMTCNYFTLFNSIV